MRIGQHARYLFTRNFLIIAAFISETCQGSLTSTNTAKGLFLFVTSRSSEGGIIANCLGKFFVENSILRRHFFACIKHSCSLGIVLMLMLNQVYALILAT